MKARVVLGRLLAFQSVRRGDRIRYLGRGSLFVLADDRRGAYVLDAAGVTQPNVAAAWLAALGAIRPDVAVDVGANYGEIALLGRYRSACVAVEANPRLAAVLRRSAETHRSAIRVVECAATAATSAHATLYVDPAWSGTTSLTERGETVAQDVAAMSVDDIVGTAPATVLMKVDVEGAEVDVLRGARRLLESASSLALIVECNDEALRAAGSSADELMAVLAPLGQVHFLTSNGRLRPVSGRPVDGKGDLVVLRGGGRQFARFRLVCFLRAVLG